MIQLPPYFETVQSEHVQSVAFIFILSYFTIATYEILRYLSNNLLCVFNCKTALHIASYFTSFIPVSGAVYYIEVCGLFPTRQPELIERFRQLFVMQKPWQLLSPPFPTWRRRVNFHITEMSTYLCCEMNENPVKF